MIDYLKEIVLKSNELKVFFRDLAHQLENL